MTHSKARQISYYPNINFNIRIICGFDRSITNAKTHKRKRRNIYEGIEKKYD